MSNFPGGGQLPMSPEERAEKEQRLAELRRRQLQQQGQNTSAAGQPQRFQNPQLHSLPQGVGQGYTSQSYHFQGAPAATGAEAFPVPHMGPGNAASSAGATRRPMNGSHPAEEANGNAGDYDDNGDIEDDPVDAAEEGFLADVEAFMQQEAANRAARGEQQQQPTGFYRFVVEADAELEQATAALPTDRHAKRDVIGDFEVLRLAKMGDKESLEEFAGITRTDLTTFVDNIGRNALHYAADSGNVALIKALVEAGVPYAKDEKSMTPLDVAVLNQHDELVLAALRNAAQKSADGGEEAEKSYEEALKAFAPEPPRFVMSKPAPPAPEAKRARALWTSTGPVLTGSASSANLPGMTVSVLTNDDIDVVSAISGVQHMDEGHGLSSWLQPLEAEPLTAQWPAVTVVGSVKGDQPVGLALGLSLGGTVKGYGSKLSSVKMGALAVAGDLVVDASQRGKGVAAAMLRCLGNVLKEKAAVAAFLSATPLPRPPTSVSMVKWFRRVAQARAVYAEDYADAVFPEFFEYDEVLRADSVRKGAVPRAMVAENEGAMEQWSAVSSSEESEAAAVLAFLRAKAGPDTGVELAYVPETVEELRSGVLATGLRAFVRKIQGSDTITDLVVFRMRQPRHATPATSAAAAEGGIAQMVYAAVTSLKGTDKATQVLLLGAEKLSASVVLVPTLFGFTDSDLAKCNYDEMATYRQFLYITGATAAVGQVPATSAAKIALPVLLL